MPVRHSKRDGKFLGAGASPSMASTTHTSPGVTGSFKTYPKTETKRGPAEVKEYRKQVASKPIAGTSLKNTQRNRQRLAKTNTPAGLKAAIAGTNAALSANRAKQAEILARHTDANGKIDPAFARQVARAKAAPRKSTSSSRKAAGRK